MEIMKINIDSLRYSYEVLEKQEYQFLFENLRVLDLGCNVGTFAMWIYPHVEQMWCVDMEQNNIDLFNKTIKDNNITNIKTYTDRVVDLNDFINGHSIKNLDVLKIDIEGDEYEVFSKPFPKIPVIIGEFHRESPRALLEAQGYRYSEDSNNHFIARI